MAAGAILNFGKMSITLDLDQIIWEDASWRRGDDHVTKSKAEVNSRDVIK